MLVYQGRKGSYTLEPTPIASGGEGVIYAIVGKRDLVAKVYRDQKFTSNRYISDVRQYMYNKILTMLDQPVEDQMTFGGKRKRLCIAWPKDVLLDHGKFVGYVMPRVNEKATIIEGEREQNRANHFNNYTWKHSVVVAYNLASLVCAVHDSGAVLGDFNPQNFLLSKDGFVIAVDADSFNVVNKKTGVVYKCSVGVPEMLPPELSGRDLMRSSSQFNVYTDYFSLAIHIFILLMNNQHPFTVTMPPTTRSSSSTSGMEANITGGKCPFTTNSVWRNRMPPGALDINMLPHYIRELFDRAFTYDTNTAVSQSVIRRRPSAYEWRSALLRLYNEVNDSKKYKICRNDISHYYPVAYGKCPFCARGNNASSVRSAGFGGSTGNNNNNQKKTKGSKWIKGIVIIAAIVTAVVLQINYFKNKETLSDDSKSMNNTEQTSSTAYSTAVDSQEFNGTPPATNGWTESDKIYVYSWDDDLERKLNIVLNNYPQYKPYVSYINLGVSSLYASQYIDSAMLNSNDKYPSLFAAELAFAKNYINDDDKTLDLKSIGFTEEMMKDTYPFAVDFGTYNNRLKAVSWQSTAGSVFYNREIARDVFGTDDPATIQEWLKDWDSFINAAKELKKKGYKIVFSVKDIYYAMVNARNESWIIEENGKEVFVPDSSITNYLKIAKTLANGKYVVSADSGTMWSAEWAAGMQDGGKVFCYFGCPWMVGVLRGNGASDGSWATCAGPSSYYWGGTYVCVGKNTNNPKLAAFLCYELTCDPEMGVKIANQSYEVATNQIANNRLNSGEITSNNEYVAFFGGQNPYETWAEVSMNINQNVVSSWDTYIEQYICEAVNGYIKGTYSSTNKAIAFIKEKCQTELGIDSK